MPVVTLPDGSQRQFDQADTVMQVAATIGAGLARAALAGRVDGKLVDAATLIEQDATLEIVTARDVEGLEIIRHSTAHLLAQAVKCLFPTAQVTIGPVIEDGFFYDFSFERPFTPEDLPVIEKKMQELVSQALPVQRRVLPRDKAVAFFRGLGETYKAEIIEAIPANEPLSLYAQGEFTDLCRGPHVPDTGRLKVFAHLADWFEEFRLYHRKDGLIVKERDDLISATRVFRTISELFDYFQQRGYITDYQLPLP